MTVDWSNPSGKALLDALVDAAAAGGVPPVEFAAPLSSTPRTWLLRLRKTACPQTATVERVRALVEGRPVPAGKPDTAPWRTEALRTGSAGIVPLPHVPPTAPVERDPCFYCGTRADLGCAHRRPSRPEDPFRFEREAA